jgi:hypothetical protein
MSMVVPSRDWMQQQSDCKRGRQYTSTRFCFTMRKPFSKVEPDVILVTNRGYDANQERKRKSRRLAEEKPFSLIELIIDSTAESAASNLSRGGVRNMRGVKLELIKGMVRQHPRGGGQPQLNYDDLQMGIGDCQASLKPASWLRHVSSP